MAGTKTRAKRTPSREKMASSFSQVYANPEAVIERIELQAESIDDPYAKRHSALTQKLIAAQRLGSVDDTNEAILLRATRAGLVLEHAARQCGFILGFEYLRDLIVASPRPRQKRERGR